jgi:hypothetical protein
MKRRWRLTVSAWPRLGRFGAGYKNTADIRLVVDVMESLITHPDVGTIRLP